MQLLFFDKGEERNYFSITAYRHNHISFSLTWPNFSIFFPWPNFPQPQIQFRVQSHLFLYRGLTNLLVSCNLTELKRSINLVSFMPLVPYSCQRFGHCIRYWLKKGNPSFNLCYSLHHVSCSSVPPLFFASSHFYFIP